MAGAKINELKKSIIVFLELLEKLDFGERVAIINFGKSVSVLSPLSQDYSKLKNIVRGLVAEGGTPMAEALALTIQQLKYTRPFQIGPMTLLPRVILFTDGEPDDKQKVGIIAKAMGEANLPMVCIGVVGCDENLMQGLAKISGGMFLMAKDIAYLQLFFMRQVLLIAYIMEVKEQMQNLYNRELLREYLESKSNQPVSDAELDGFIYFLRHIVQQNDNTLENDNTVQTYESKGCYCCCCLCSCRNVVTSFLFLVCIAAICWSGYSLHVGTTVGYIEDSSINAFAIASLIMAILFNCGCSLHLIWLRTKEDDTVLWLVEVLTILFLLVPQILLFVAVFVNDGAKYVLPSAITIVSVMGVCCCCNCIVRCTTS